MFSATRSPDGLSRAIIPTSRWERVSSPTTMHRACTAIIAAVVTTVLSRYFFGAEAAFNKVALVGLVQNMTGGAVFLERFVLEPASRLVFHMAFQTEVAPLEERLELVQVADRHMARFALA